MNGCRPFRELLSAALDGPLAPEDRARIDTHLEACAGCRAYARDLGSVRQAVQELEGVEPPPWMASRIMAQVRAEAAPKPSFWPRVRAVLLKPQFQVATLLVVGVTSALLIRSRSGLRDADVLREMKAPAPADQERAPAASAPAASAVPATPAGPPRMRAVEEPQAGGKAGHPAGEDRAKDSREAEGFAPAPPARPAEAGSAPPPPPAPSQPATPAPQAAPEAKAFGWTEAPKPAKPSVGSGPGAANTAAGARAERAEPARDQASGRLDDAAAKSKKAGAPAPAAAAAPVLAKEQPGKGVEKQEEDATSPGALLQWEPEDTAGAAALAAREVEALGGTVFREGRRQQQAVRALTARIPAHLLPQLQARLARHGAVRPGGTQQQQAPRGGSVVVLIRW